MTSSELVQSWARTEGFLREARANVSQIGEAEFSDQLDQFDELISHNELGLAFDALEAIAQEGSWESLRLLELLALAAASMGLVRKRSRGPCAATESGWTDSFGTVRDLSTTCHRSSTRWTRPGRGT